MKKRAVVESATGLEVTLHFRVSAEVKRRLEALASRVAGARASDLARAFVERGLAAAEKNPASELIRSAS